MISTKILLPFTLAAVVIANMFSDDLAPFLGRLILEFMY